MLLIVLKWKSMYGVHKVQMPYLDTVWMQAHSCEFTVLAVLRDLEDNKHDNRNTAGIARLATGVPR
jgi:hypothetical protein